MSPEERIKLAEKADRDAKEAQARGDFYNAAAYRQEAKALRSGIVQIEGSLPKFRPNN